MSLSVGPTSPVGGGPENTSPAKNLAANHLSAADALALAQAKTNTDNNRDSGFYARPGSPASSLSKADVSMFLKSLTEYSSDSSKIEEFFGINPEMTTLSVQESFKSFESIIKEGDSQGAISTLDDESFRGLQVVLDYVRYRPGDLSQEIGSSIESLKGVFSMSQKATFETLIEKADDNTTDTLVHDLLFQRKEELSSDDETHATKTAERLTDYMRLRNLIPGNPDQETVHKNALIIKSLSHLDSPDLRLCPDPDPSLIFPRAKTTTNEYGNSFDSRDRLALPENYQGYTKLKDGAPKKHPVMESNGRKIIMTSMKIGEGAFGKVKIGIEQIEKDGQTHYLERAVKKIKVGDDWDKIFEGEKEWYISRQLGFDDTMCISYEGQHRDFAIISARFDYDISQPTQITDIKNCSHTNISGEARVNMVGFRDASKDLSKLKTLGLLHCDFERRQILYKSSATDPESARLTDFGRALSMDSPLKEIATQNRWYAPEDYEYLASLEKLDSDWTNMTGEFNPPSNDDVAKYHELSNEIDKDMTGKFATESNDDVAKYHELSDAIDKKYEAAIKKGATDVWAYGVCIVEWALRGHRYPLIIPQEVNLSSHFEGYDRSDTSETSGSGSRQKPSAFTPEKIESQLTTYLENRIVEKNEQGFGDITQEVATQIIDLAKKCLVQDPSKRINPEDIADHPLFKLL